MSLFSSLLGDFDDDGYMGNQMNAMNMQMRSMNRLMASPLMADPFSMLPFGIDGGFNNHHALMERHNAPPMGNLFGFPSMPNINRLLSADIGANGGSSYCSSSVISMSSGPDGRPQIYQATSSTKTGPGGVRETRKTVQDSRTGVKKMAIGHHIGERAHIIEKEQNLRSGENEERQEFINLEEEEAEDFDREFVNKANVHSASRGEITNGKDHKSYSRHQRQLPSILPPPPANSASNASQSTASTATASPNHEKFIKKCYLQHAATEEADATTTATAVNSSDSHISEKMSRQAHRRRTLRTPCSSPLALTSANQSASPTTSVHPYNNTVARRNHHRSKHSKQQQQDHVQAAKANNEQKKK